MIEKINNTGDIIYWIVENGEVLFGILDNNKKFVTGRNKESFFEKATDVLAKEKWVAALNLLNITNQDILDHFEIDSIEEI